MTTLSTIKKLSVIAAGATCLSLGAINPAHALNLVNNGGFETNGFSGWKQSGNQGNTGFDLASANSGSFGAFLGSKGSKSLSQTLATVAGQSYDLSFFFKEDITKATSKFLVKVGSNTISFDGFPAIPGFYNFRYSFVAATPSTLLKFTSKQDPSNYLRLDDVSVTATAIPTPALLPGLLGLGVGVLRKRKAAATAVEA